MKNLALYYGMELADKNALPVADDRIATLGKLHEALLHAWSRETAFPACREDWSMSNPAFGQCTITAMLVHDLFGGTIHRVRLAGGGTHYFNKIDGMYVDLTSNQFADYANECPLEPNEERERPVCGRSTDTWNRYRLLIDNINAWLLSESDDGRITPLMPCGTAPEAYRPGRRVYEEAAGGYAAPAGGKTGREYYEKNSRSKEYRPNGNYAKYKNGEHPSKKNIKIRQAMGVCPECGGALVKRSGKYGDFLGCSHYPECHFTVPLDKAEFKPQKSAGDEENC
ncbi:MAG: topoisomerase DNA-binding C4 zinc finger domain-containing protein, partial [Elusimicrobiales bacterium]|nr:topoisomerase DNA-binding C4 zinc finger domain-containing protein [Elusimicrobiales bacterium]